MNRFRRRRVGRGLEVEGSSVKGLERVVGVGEVGTVPREEGNGTRGRA